MNAARVQSTWAAMKRNAWIHISRLATVGAEGVHDIGQKATDVLLVWIDGNELDVEL
jgi:hypothetical protein